MTNETVEIRCPSSFRKLFMRMQVSSNSPKYLQEENWIEIACYDCLKEQRKQDAYKDEEQEVVRVLHYYSFLGELMKTAIVRAGEPF